MVPAKAFSGLVTPSETLFSVKFVLLTGSDKREAMNSNLYHRGTLVWRLELIPVRKWVHRAQTRIQVSIPIATRQRIRVVQRIAGSRNLVAFAKFLTIDGPAPATTNAPCTTVPELRFRSRHKSLHAGSSVHWSDRAGTSTPRKICPGCRS